MRKQRQVRPEVLDQELKIEYPRGSKLRKLKQPVKVYTNVVTDQCASLSNGVEELLSSRS